MPQTAKGPVFALDFFSDSSAMEELLSVDVEDDTIDIPGPSQPAESGADLALQLRQATEREAEVRASLAEATDAQTKVEALLQTVQG